MVDRKIYCAGFQQGDRVGYYTLMDFKFEVPNNLAMEVAMGGGTKGSIYYRECHVSAWTMLGGGKKGIDLARVRVDIEDSRNTVLFRDQSRLVEETQNTFEVEVDIPNDPDFDIPVLSGISYNKDDTSIDPIYFGILLIADWNNPDSLVKDFDGGGSGVISRVNRETFVRV